MAWYFVKHKDKFTFTRVYGRSRKEENMWDVAYKIKPKLLFCLIKHHKMKTYGEWRYNSTHS